MPDIYDHLFPGGTRPQWATLSSLRGELAAVTDPSRPVRVAVDDGAWHLLVEGLSNADDDENGPAVVLETADPNTAPDPTRTLTVGQLVWQLDAALEAARTYDGGDAGPWDDRPILASDSDGWYVNVPPVPPGSVTDDGAHDGAPVVIATRDDYDTRQW